MSQEGFVQKNIDASVGALLAGTWLNSGLFSLEILLLYKYFTRNNEFTALKAGMVGLLLVDLTSTLADYACVWLYAIAHWGDEAFLANQYWPIPVYLVTTGISACFMQGFLLLRVFRLSRNYFLCIAIIPVCLAALGGAVATAALVIVYPGYADRHHLNTGVSVWLISSAAADVLIAGVLILYLNRVRKTAARFEQSALSGNIKRLIRVAVETGSVTSAGAVVIVSIYLNNPEENISTGLCFGLGRAYSLTLLMNLNAAHNLAKKNNESDQLTNGGMTGTKRGAAFGLSGIAVGHTTTVQVEDAREDPIRLEDLREFARRNAEPLPTTFEIGKPSSKASDEKDSWERGV